jgi:protein SCO1/2
MKRVLFLIILLAICIPVGYFLIKPKDKKDLPIINPIDVQEEMVDPELLRIGQGHTIGNFSFKNQDNKTITQREIEGKVFVAEYFFSTCKSICPIMNQQMQRIQYAFKDNPNVKILSFTVDPDVDTVEQLKRYANSHNAVKNQWHFLTGKKEDLYGLARKSFFVLKPAEVANQGDVGSDFIHTNNFVLVDQQKRIRGYYDGTSEKEVTELIKDISRLLEE